MAQFNAATVCELDSGIRLVVRENHRNPTLCVAGIIPAGSIDDPPDAAGTGNFTVSMLPNGTENYTKLELAEVIESAGIEIGFSLSRESFRFSGRALSEDAGLLLALMAEQLRRPVFPEAELDTTRRQILTSILASEDDTYDVSYYRARDMAYGTGHPFAGRIEGTPGTVAGLGAGALQAWHRRHIHPEGMVLVLVGDTTPEAACRLVEEHFGGWEPRPREGRQALLARGAEFQRVGGQRRDVEMADKSNVSLTWIGPGTDKCGIDRWAQVLVMNFILGGGFSSRLNDELRLKAGLTYGSFSWFGNGRAAGPLCVSVQVNPRNLDTAVRLTEEELARYAANGAEAEELKIAQDYLTGNYYVRLATNLARAGAIAELEYLGKGLAYLENYGTIINRITLEQVREQAGLYCQPANFGLVAAGSLGAGGYAGHD
jgi:zinc protease